MGREGFGDDLGGISRAARLVTEGEEEEERGESGQAKNQAGDDDSKHYGERGDQQVGLERVAV